MLRRIPSGIVKAVFAALFVIATYPAWSVWIFGYNPSLDDLLSLRCFTS
jgi:hypothetical protein